MVRFATPVAVLALSLGAPSGALAASDGGTSLLSGYGGPGGGEQVLLGGGLSGGGSASGGSGVRGESAQGTSAPADPQRAPLAAPAQSSSSASATRPTLTPSPTRPTATSHGHGHGRPTSVAAPPTTSTASPVGTPTPAPAVRISERTGGDAGSPISARDLGVLAVVLLALGALAAATRAFVLGAANEAGASRLSGAAARMARTRAAARKG